MEKILVLDFGGQYDQLIARRVREQKIYAELIPYNKISASEVEEAGYKGIIFTGGPASVYDESSLTIGKEFLELGIPVLGICYGAQLIAHLCGGKVSSAASKGEYGKSTLRIKACALFCDVPEISICWMSHRDHISSLPKGFENTAVTDSCPCAAFSCDEKKLYGVQFHPEVTHTEYGEKILNNFLFKICGCSGDWIVGEYAESLIEKYKTELKGKKVLLALSGGVDSSVAAALLNKAIGKNLICVFVDHGLLRKGEADLVVNTFRKKLGMNLIKADAGDRFLNNLKGIEDPEEKRKIIGEGFIRVFEEEAGKIGHVDYLAQGTIYPDVIESGKGDSAVIKSHHNVGGLPDVISFDGIIEPLRDLFKDEVRNIGSVLGLPNELIWRQPFPGPGLGVRVMGEVTAEKLGILREADAIFTEEVEKAEMDEHVDQYFAVLTGTRSVGVMGDSRTYGYTAALRCVTTDDFMTAEWTRLPYEVLDITATRIMNEVPGISRVVYDISSKPPSTVEWE